jgi:hypothetical protein
MKTIEQAITAISNRIDRIVKYQDDLEQLMLVDDHFVELYFEQEAVKGELLSLLSYIEEPQNGKISS